MFKIHPTDWFRGLFPHPTDPDLGELKTSAFDGIPWSYPEQNPTVLAIGDLHGDIIALASLLYEAGYIDDLGNWIAGHSHLVLLGDLIGGHADSRFLLEFVLRLDDMARRSGGFVHTLLGNHDILALRGELKAFSKKEKKRFRKYPLQGEQVSDVSEALSGYTPYAMWLRRCNVVLTIGDSLFVHAGLGHWAEHVDIGRVNTTVRDWVKYWQGVGPKPPKATQWTVGKLDMKRGSRWEAGPAWNRTYRVKEKSNGKLRHRPEGNSLTEPELRKILFRLGARRMLVGHAPVDSGEILFHHPAYGAMVIMADTRLSDADGELCAVLIREQNAQQIRAKNRKAGKRVRQELKDLLEQQRNESRQVDSGIADTVWARLVRFLKKT